MGRRHPVVVHLLEAVGGGTARHLVNVVRNTHGIDHHVVIPPKRVGWVTDDLAAHQLRAAGAAVTTLDMRRSPAALQNASSAVRLTSMLASLKPDVIHGHSSMGGALARVVPTRAARVYTPNGIHPSGAAVRFEQILGKLTDRLIAVSESEADLSRRHRLVPEQRLLTIPNGIDLVSPPQVDLREMLGLSKDTLIVGTIARVAPQKAPEHFLDVADLVLQVRPNVVFVLIGHGPGAAALDIAALPLGDSFRRIPVIPDATTALQSMDVFCLLSRYEGAPYAPLEAARSGVPLVLTDVVGNKDVIEDGVSGLLVESGDVEAAAKAVLRLLDDSFLGKSLAEAMQTRLEERFDVREQGRQHSELYHALCS